MALHVHAQTGLFHVSLASLSLLSFIMGLPQALGIARYQAPQVLTRAWARCYIFVPLLAWADLRPSRNN